MLLTFAWSLVVIIAPEFILVDSLRDLWEARRCLKELRRADNTLDMTESQQHIMSPGLPGSNSSDAQWRNASPGSSANRARAPSSEDDHYEHASKHVPLLHEPWTLTHMLYANMGGFVVKDMSEEQDTRYLTVTGKLVPLAIERKLIAPEPPASKAEIKDKSKDNNYTKLLAVMQIVYFGVEIIVRLALHLPITQLELAVASVACYAVVTYFFLWLKPKAVETPTLIAPWNNSLRKMEQQLRELSGSTKDLNLQADIDAALKSHSDQDESFRRQASQKIASLGNFFKSGTEKEKTIWVVVFIVASAPIGVMHLLAWNWYFHTDIDLWIWRIASIIATGAGPVLLPVYLVLRRLGRHSAATSCFWCTAMLYVLARFALTAQMVRCLFYMQPEAYLATNWVMNIPHIG